MKGWMRVLGGVALAAVLLLAGCGGDATEAVPAEEVPAVTGNKDLVVAEGVVEPARWIELRAPSASLKVVEVPVETGDVVVEGDVLVRLDPTAAALATERAKAALARSEAQLAQARAHALPEEIAVTEARLAGARAALAEAEARRDRLSGGETETEVAAARAALAAAQAEEKQAFYLHERTLECFTFTWNDKEHTICPALGRPEETTRHAWHAAQDSLDAAQTELTAAQDRSGARTREAGAALAVATARERALQADLDLQRAGSLEEEIAVAESGVAEAEASLLAARAALDRMVVHAPFDAIVVDVFVTVGDTAAPGETIVVLAALDQLRVRTKDLTELDVVRLTEGRPVSVTLDALPDTPFEGRVLRIDSQSEDYRGDVTYPVIVELLQSPEGLRWGMTALVEIHVE